MRRFWIIAAAILLWYLLGGAIYIMQATADLDALSRRDPATAEAFRSMPIWAWVAYAMAVWLGTAGAVLLLTRRKAARMFFALSLAGVVGQFAWAFLGHGLIAAKGWSTTVFPAVIFAIGLASLLYARAKAADGTLR